MSYQRDSRAVVGTLVTVVRDSPLTLLAAGIAYYAFVSVFPLLLLGFAVVTTVGGETLALSVVERAGAVLSPSGEELVETALLDAGPRGGATVVGLLVLVWGGLKLFRGLDVAFSMIYDTRGDESFLGQLRNAITALGAVGLAVAATVLVGIAARFLGVEVAGILGTVGLVAVLTAAFVPLYYIFPGVDIRVREALPGAVFAAVGWTVLSNAFQLYAEGAGVSVYGVVGGVLLLVTWFYIGGIVLLLGAVLNGVLTGDVGASGDRQLQQARLRESAQRAMSEPGTEDDETEPDTGPSQSDETEPDTGSSQSDEIDDLKAEIDELQERLEETESDTGPSQSDEMDDLKAEIDELQERLEEKVVHRDDLEDDLQKYIRWKLRRGKARGWGPYLVLLYGTTMTLGGFYFLSGVWAVLAMLVIWLSTLGLYVLMLLVGFGLNLVSLPGRARDRFL